MSAPADLPLRRDPSGHAPSYVRELSPYVPGKPIEELAREFGLAEAEIVKLASNENPRGPSAAVRAAIAAVTNDVCRYPDGNGFALKSALSAVTATISLVIFALFGPVDWLVVAVAAPASLVGGFLGARVATRIPVKPLRILIVGFGVAVSIYLFLRV